MKKLAILLLLLLPVALFGEANLPANLPWISVLDDLTTFFTGAFARTVSILALFGAGLTLIFGHQELPNFVKTVLYIILVVTFIVAAQAVLAVLFPSSGFKTSG